MLERVNQDLKAAMKDKDELRVSVLRMLLSSLTNRKIELKADKLPEDQVTAVIKTEIKKRKDSAAAFEEGGRDELKQKEEAETKILEDYLPEQLGQEQIEAEIKSIIAEMGDVGASDFGRVMGRAMSRLKGRADGALVRPAVEKALGK